MFINGRYWGFGADLFGTAAAKKTTTGQIM